MAEISSWLEISLTVDGELAEAVAEVLARHTPGGVVIESTAITPDPNSAGRPTGPLRVCSYIPMDEKLEGTRQRIEQGLYFLGRIQPLPPAEFKPIANLNWSETWKQHYRPIKIGKKFIIVPAWLEIPDKTRIPIRIDPGMAFGTGTHPTTQLCLALLEHYLRAGHPILDVGCGSGILSIAALKLGASRAFGVDTDFDAIAAAEENAIINNVAENSAFSVGSVEKIQSGHFPIRSAPVVMANILAPILLRLLDDGLSDLVHPEGVLLLSGILEEQFSKIQTALQPLGFHIKEKRQTKDWIALSAVR